MAAIHRHSKRRCRVIAHKIYRLLRKKKKKGSSDLWYSFFFFRFYNVSPMAVKATAMIWSISFIIFLYPMTWLIHKKGIRFICVIASASICLGTWIKYFAIYPDQFSLILVGQCFIGAWQLTVVSLPATLAATWFGPNEMATATAFGCTGTVFGIALSYIFGPLLVKTHNGEGDIGKDLNHYTLPLGFYCTSVLFLMFLCKYCSNVYTFLDQRSTMEG